MERHAPSKLNTQIYEEACSWFVDCRGGDLDEASRREFDRWLRKSPEHLSAYLEIASIWNEGPKLDPSNKWDAETLIAQATHEPDNVVALSRGPASSPLPSEEERASARFAGEPLTLPQAEKDRPARRADEVSVSRRWLVSLAASILVCATALGIYLYSQRGVYATGVGEQRSIQLADGSTVELNSRSKIRVSYVERERGVELLEGQALFHVAKDHTRPFIVSAGDTHVRAVGTQFDVYRKTADTTVTVIEGRVAVYPTSDPSNPFPDPAGIQPVTPLTKPAPQEVPTGQQGTTTPAALAKSAEKVILLSAGEQLVVTSQIAEKAERPNVAGAIAWTQRQIVFDSATLSEVAEEFNRYNQRRLVIEDPQLLMFHISGVFSSTDPESFVRFLRQRSDIRVTETTSEIRIAKNIS